MQSVHVPACGPIVRVVVPLEQPLPWAEGQARFRLRGPDGAVWIAQHDPCQYAPIASATALDSVLLTAVVDGYQGPVDFQVELGVAERERGFRWTRFSRVLAATLTGEYAQGVPGLPQPQERMCIRRGPCSRTYQVDGEGFKLWFTVFSNQDVAQVEVLLLNGEAHSPDRHFDSFSLVAPGLVTGLGFESLWPEPFDTGIPANAVETCVLVPRRGSAAHTLIQRGMRVFSGWLYTTGSRDLAVRLAGLEGLGFADGWTEAFGKWQAHRLPLPKLDAIAAQLRAQAATEWNTNKSALASGGPWGMFATATQGVRIDWLHPWGNKYGGSTSGSYRHQWEAANVVGARSLAGVLELHARVAGIMARDPIALVDGRNRPLRLEDWTANGAAIGGWHMSIVDPRFTAGKDGPFGFQAAMAGKAIGSDAAEMRAYAPMDWQHRDRATQPAVALALLTNSDVAKWWLRMSSEMWLWSQFSHGGLNGRLSAAMARPNMGSSVGRADAHGATLVASANMFTPPAKRQRLRLSMLNFAHLLQLCQTPSGLWRSDAAAGNKEAKAPPFGDGTKPNWTVTRSTEEGLLAGALIACLRQLSLSATQELALLMQARAWALDGVWGGLWRRGAAGNSPHVLRNQRRINYTSSGVTYDDPLPNDSPQVIVAGYDREETIAGVGAVWLACKVIGADFDLQQQVDWEVVMAAMLTRYCEGSTAPLAWMFQNQKKARLDEVAPIIAALQR